MAANDGIGITRNGEGLAVIGCRAVGRVLTAIAALALAGTVAGAYEAEIRRTDFGIPHIRAADWGSLGYGYGYAYAQDNYCVGMRAIVEAAGRSAEFFGEERGDLAADFVLRLVLGGKDAFRRRFLADAESPAAQLFAGFAAGMNRYRRDTGIGALPAACRDAPWVADVDAADIGKMLARVALQGSSDQSLVRRAIFDASIADGGAAAEARPPAPPPDAAARRAMRLELQRFGRALASAERGSNGIAVGRDLSRTGKGMLLGNPHQPWHGPQSFYQVHLTIPGVLDVAGAAQHGMPFVGIGFNRHIAWTHTVSFATRFTLYELELDAVDGRRYRYGDGYRRLTPKRIAVRVRNADGTLDVRRRTFLVSHYGPLVDLRSVSGLLATLARASGRAFAIRDANVDRYREMGEQYVRMNRADSLRAFTDALAGIGVPVFHTLAVDRAGEAFYGEVSSVPALGARHYADACAGSWMAALLRNETNGAVLALDGGTSDCAWGRHPDSPRGTNIAGFRSRPKLWTTDYAANSNDSYWLSNADAPLSGFRSAFGWLGGEGAQQMLRTRISHRMVADRRRAADGLSSAPGFTLGTLKRMMYRNRVHAAELVLDDVLAVCAGLARNALAGSPAARAQRACDALSRWNRRADAGSRGTQVFTLFWERILAEKTDAFDSVVDDPAFWAVDFDPLRPLDTPSGIDLAVAANRDLVAAALAAATLELDALGVPLGARWGDVQYVVRGGKRLPIHGGDGRMGVYGAISARLRDGGGARIRSGNSYLQAVTWGDGPCPVADTMLVPGQSDNPRSRRYRDQTSRYSRKQWVRFPFCESQIRARQQGATLRIAE